MKIYGAFIAIGCSTVLSLATAQQVGTSEAEVHPPLAMETCSASGCTAESTSVVVDANWRWTHTTNGSTNCYTGNKWDDSLCADPKKCAANCAIDGAKYKETYGVSTSGKEITLSFVNKHQYGTNIGSRLYMMQDEKSYKMFKLLNQEFAFDVDASALDCGLNGALYFVAMDQDGGMSKYAGNKAGAKYGTGYCDAQCPHDIKFINGEANVLNWTPSKNDANSGAGKYGSCCAEMDIWEANKISNAYTSHPCDATKVNGQYRCSSDAECGTGPSSNRYKGVCDRDGCDINPFRAGNHNFYGPGAKFTIDSTKPVTVVTQFITDDKTATGNLVEIKRLYKQGGKVIPSPPIAVTGIDKTDAITDKVCKQMKTAFGDTDDHSAKGGLKAMGAALKKGMVLTMSLWDDHEANCLWLDAAYPTTKSATAPGVARGTCSATSGVPSEIESSLASATVKFSNIRVGPIGSTTGGASTSTSTTTTAPAAGGATAAPSTDEAGSAAGSYSPGNVSPASPSTSSPSSGAPAAPSADTTPAGGASTTPSGGASTTPSGGASTTPSGGASTTPSGGASTTPSGGASTAPSGGASTAPSGGASNAPVPKPKKHCRRRRN